MFKTVLPLSSIIGLRFLGLFLVLPVISIYALDLKGSDTLLVGIVIGGYALTQMIFQVPFGIMSDKLGRKGTIITGLLLFCIGSVVCALSPDIFSLMLGRFLQGAGAIGAVVTATISDVVKENERGKAMSLMGGTIAISFAISMMAGPIISAYFGIASLFWITAVAALIPIYVTIKWIPDPPKIAHTYNTKFKVSRILKDVSILKMMLNNFLQKGLMTFAFMIIPITLTKTYHWEFSELWKVYMPAMLGGLIVMGPAAMIAEKYGRFREVLVLGIICFGVAYFFMGKTATAGFFVLGVAIFFIGANMHEPIMQSLTSKFARVYERGAVLGVFNSCGYLGTFIGGILGGAFLQKINLSQISTAILVIVVIWAILIATMPNPAKKRAAYLKLSEISRDKLSSLASNDAIDEWYVNETEAIAVVKYSSNKIKLGELKKLLV